MLPHTRGSSITKGRASNSNIPARRRATMTELFLAEATDYNMLRNAVRQRVEQLNIHGIT
jgi:hypothetical protein